MNRKFSLIAAGIALVVAAGAAAASWAESAAPNSAPSNADANLPPEKASIEAFDRALDASLAAQAKDPSAVASIVAEKSRAAQLYRESRAANPQKNETVLPDQGIRATREAPIPWLDFQPTSYWGGKVDGDWYAVYAGADGQDTSIGAVMAEPWTVSTVSSHESRSAFYYLKDVGSLTIVDQDGSTLVLTDSNGNEHRFDVLTGTFTS